MITIMKNVPVEVDYKIKWPMYRSQLIGEYGVGRFQKKYWKFDSHYKVTVITEKMCSTEILTYDDPHHDNIKIMCSEDMLYGHADYDIIDEKGWNRAVDRLVNQLAKGI